MRQGRRTTTPSLLAGGEQAEPLTGLDWGCALVGERLVAAARVAAAMHTVGAVAARLEAESECDELPRRTRL